MLVVYTYEPKQQADQLIWQFLTVQNQNHEKINDHFRLAAYGDGFYFL